MSHVEEIALPHTEDFVTVNQQFWSKYREKDCSDLILVETSLNPIINHSNAVMAKIVAQAKNMRIAWLRHCEVDPLFLRSYSQNSEFIDYPDIPIINKFWFFILSVYFYLFYAIIKRRVLSFQFRGVDYGDFVYDNYLAYYSMATLHQYDLRVIKSFYDVLVDDQKARRIFECHPVKGVLISHYTGKVVGCLARVAMQRKIPVYWKGGGHNIVCLATLNGLNEAHSYPLKPTVQQVDQMIAQYQHMIESDFDEFIDQVNNPFFGSLSVGYRNNTYSDITREEFLKKTGLKDQPIAFLMMHAFNDFPHSLFEGMLFEDYYDWFIQTLSFLKADTEKNWIIKEHPANDTYPTKDFDTARLMKDLPDHVRFLSMHSEMTAATVLNVADLIVTCLGSAGMEMPALNRIPALICGDTPFSGLGFTIEPQSREEYFLYLKNWKPEKLTSMEQLRAKSCYMYIKKYSKVPFSAGPQMTFEQVRYPERIEGYASSVIQCYQKHAPSIYNEFEEYLGKVKKADFKRLLRIDLD